MAGGLTKIFMIEGVPQRSGEPRKVIRLESHHSVHSMTRSIRKLSDCSAGRVWIRSLYSRRRRETPQKIYVLFLPQHFSSNHSGPDSRFGENALALDLHDMHS